MACRGHIFCAPRRCLVKIGRVKMQGSHNGAGWMPSGSVPCGTTVTPRDQQGSSRRMCPLTSASPVVKAMLYIKNWQKQAWWSRLDTERCPTGPLWDFYGLTVRLKCQENWDQPTQHHGALTAAVKYPGTCRNCTGKSSPNICRECSYGPRSVLCESPSTMFVMEK